MSSRGLEFYLPLAGATLKEGVVEVQLYHRKGGMSYSNYKTYKAGHFLSIGVIYFDYDSYQRSGLVGKGFALFSAPTVQLDEYPKLNKKRVSELFAEVRGQIEAKSGPHWERFRAVLAEKGKAVLERPSEGLVAVLAGVDGPIDRVQTLPVWGKIEADVGLKAEFYAWWAVRGGDTLVSDLVK